MPPPSCTHKGCLKPFVEDENSDTACEYHPGAPLFHEGLKGWSCCSKKVTDFDEFLKIPGCTVGRHTTEVQAPPPAATATTAAKEPTFTTGGTEVYGAPAPAPAAPVPSVTATAAKPAPKPIVREQDLHDAPDAVIAVGTTCRRKGCGKKFENDKSREEECVFHPGAPVFHEGSKGWSCCPRKVLEFDEFMRIAGCATGRHRFTDGVKPISDENASAASEPEEWVDCRRDWYQTPGSVIISLFAKKVDKANTSVSFSTDELKVDGKFLDGKLFKFHTALIQPIIPEQSKYVVLSTKVEITLKKANGISWPTIEPQDTIVSWTTFGTTGTVGTIGGKEAFIAADAPVHLFSK